MAVPTSTQSSLPFNLIPTQPALVDALNLFKKDILLNLACHHVGTIQSFNATLQTCTATVNYPKTYFTLNKATGLYSPTLVSYPLLLDVPVIALGGGKAALTMPVTTGDECLLVFNDRDINNWWSGGAGAAVATPRLHSLADGIAIVGLRSIGNALANFDTVRAVLRGASAVVGVNTSNSKVLVTNVAPSGSGGVFTYSATLGTILQQLTTQLQNLTTAIAAITVTGVTSGGAVSGVPANAAAIAAIGTAIGTTATALAGLLE